MLQLLRPPEWSPEVLADGSAPVQRPVPATLPGCLLVYLASQEDGRGTWLDRERLGTFFWPDRPTGEGLHNLRVNLHRVRSLLADWGQAEALAAERARVRLSLPTDLACLAPAIAQADPPALLRWRPRGWLQGFRIAGFEAFWSWADDLGQRQRRAWRAACERALIEGLRAGAPAATLQALFEAWLADGGSRMPGLAALDPLMLAPEVRGTWQHLCARLPEAGAPAAGLRGAAPAPSPAGAQPVPGRAAAQDALRASAAPAVLLLAEPGAGKTTLLRACWPAAPLLRAREGLGGVPYAPVLELLRTQAARGLLRPGSAPGGLPPALAPYRLDLARLLPELAPDEPLPPLDALTAKARLLEALARWFEQQGPCLLVDDLQWCDGATLEWLVFLAHRGSLRWRATARPHELTGPARQALDSLLAARLLAEQRLAPLDRAGLRAACEARWPQRAWTEVQLGQLHQASAGNPFVLGELVAAGALASAAPGSGPVAAPALPLPRRVRDLLEQRLRGLGAPAREVVEAAAVLGSPATPGLLLALADGLDETGLWRACREALAAELLHEDEAGLQCRHDLIRSATLAAIGPTRRAWLHRRAALALGALPQAEPLAVAAHWEAAQEPQTALAWLQRGAARQKERGRFDEAVALWQRVAEESLDATQVLRARLALAECDLLHDLARGRAALQLVLDELGAVADPLQRDQIEAQALAGLVDNAVFAGQVPAAQALAPRLRELLPRLAPDDRVHGCEVLIELAMREPDIPAAHALLAQVRRLAPRRPSTLSFEAQIHWFGGDPRAARDAFEALLARHPDYCSGLTIENDLAVMLHALGELTRAETMARRSLASWQGVLHTETLSLLVLGAVLTSAGRHDEAQAALDRALALGRTQSSALFEAEALVRRARLWLQCGRFDAALDDLGPAGQLLAESGDPLRVSQYALHTVLAQLAAGRPAERGLADRLRTISLRSAHPLLHARMARIEAGLALSDGEPLRAHRAAVRQAEICRAAGLLEPLAEALLLQAQALALAARSPGAPPPPDDALALVHEAAALADAQGFADLAWRAHAWLASVLHTPMQHRALREARLRLQGEGDALFDAAAAALRPPWPPNL